MTAIASAGYSPPEQYESDGHQGAWTDVYALSALCYRAITGDVPMEAPRRQSQLLRTRTDPLPKLANAGREGYSPEFLEAVDRGLRVIEAERPQNLDEWLPQLERAGAQPSRDSELTEASQPASSPTAHQTGKRKAGGRDDRVPWLVAVLLLLLWLVWFAQQKDVGQIVGGHRNAASDGRGSLPLPVGDRFRDCPECPEMVVVPAGSYRMGSPSYEQGRQEDEGPVHEVTIAASFAIGRHEVTVAEFGRFVDETGYSAGSSCWTYENGEWESRAGRGWRNPGFGQSGRHPVVCVDWNGAQAYVAWLSRQTGEEYRLPSESEWEYAARAGTATVRYWGEGELGQCRHANGGDASLKERYSDWPWPVASCRDGHVHTAPAGSFAANGWGLHDMLGNVWEWTEDCWNGSYAGAPSDGGAWEYGDCSVRVLRGGSWIYSPSVLRAADRFRNSTGVRSFSIGFRVARTLAP